MKVLYQDTKERLKKTKNALRTDRQMLKPGSEQNTSRRKVRCNNAVPTCYKTERSNKKLCSEKNSVQNILSSSQQLHTVTTANIPFFPTFDNECANGVLAKCPAYIHSTLVPEKNRKGEKLRDF